MGFWSRIREAFEDGNYSDDTGTYPDHDDEDDNEFADRVMGNRDIDDVEPPTPLAKLMARVMQYRDEELRDLQARTFAAERETQGLRRDLSMVQYERNEALNRIGKIFAILNKKQQAQLAKPPVELKFGPPPLRFLGFDETGRFRQIEVPTPAKMETVERKGDGPQSAGTVLNSDRKTGRGKD